MCDVTYLEKMTNAQLAQEYATYANDSALRELESRDELATMTIDERMGLAMEERERADNQMLFEFAKEKDVSVKAEAPDPWNEAYEAGFKVGHKQGVKETIAKLDKISDEFDREFVADTFQSGSGL